MPFPELNLKQAWLIPSADRAAQPERHGAGLVRPAARRPGRRRPARAAARDAADVGRRGRCRGSRRSGLGADVASADLPPGRDRRVAGGRHARRGAAAGDQPDRRDLRPGRGRRRPGLGRRRRRPDRPTALVEAAAAERRSSQLGDHVWATGETTWSEAIGTAARRTRLDAGRRRDRDRGQRRRPARRRRRGSASTSRSRPTRRRRRPHGPRPDDAGRRRRAADDLVRFAERARELGGAEVGLAVRARPRTGDTAVSIAVSTPAGERHGQPDRLPGRADGPLARGAGRRGGPARDRCATARRRRPTGATSPIATATMARVPADPPGRLRLTVLGCSTAVPHSGWPAAGFLVEWGDDGAAARRRPGRRPPPPARARPARPGGRHRRPHARRPLPRPGRPALPVPVGRGRPTAPAGPPAARRPGAAWTRWPWRSRSGPASSTPPSRSTSTTRTGRCAVGPLTVRFIRGRHYVPAWGLVGRGARRRPARLHRRHRTERRGGRLRPRRRPAARRGALLQRGRRRPASAAI